MSTSTRIWAVSEKELLAEITFLKGLPAYQMPVHMSVGGYEILLRKIAYWHISRMNIIALGVISLLLLGGTVMFYNAQHDLTWINGALLKLLLVIVVVYTGLYFLAGIPLNKYKTKLSVK